LHDAQFGSVRDQTFEPEPLREAGEGAGGLGR
jgi:hypothetical protein